MARKQLILQGLASLLLSAPAGATFQYGFTDARIEINGSIVEEDPQEGTFTDSSATDGLGGLGLTGAYSQLFSDTPADHEIGARIELHRELLEPGDGALLQSVQPEIRAHRHRPRPYRVGVARRDFRHRLEQPLRRESDGQRLHLPGLLLLRRQPEYLGCPGLLELRSAVGRRPQLHELVKLRPQRGGDRDGGRRLRRHRPRLSRVHRWSSSTARSTTSVQASATT